VKFRIVSEYLGPNVSAPIATIRARFEPGLPLNWRSDRSVAAFLEPLDGLLPDLRARFKSPDGSPEPMVTVSGENSVSVAHIVAHITTALQRRAGYRAEFAKAAPTDRPDVFEIICEYRDKTVYRLAMRPACMLFLNLLPPDERLAAGVPADFDPAADLRKYLLQAERHGLGASAAAIVRAAEIRGIPWRRLVPGERIVQLGQGIFQRRLVDSAPDQAGMVAGEIASSNLLTGIVVAALGLPVVEFKYVSSVDKAVAAADKLQYPVVVKPIPRSGGSHLPARLTKPQEVRAAFGRAVGKAGGALVQKFVEGDRHRLLVIGGSLIAACRCVADSAAQGGRRKANFTTIDVTDEVHPDNRDMAIEAAAVVGLPVAGIDIITPDIGRSYLEAGGSISGVTRTPDLRLHWMAAGEKRDVVAPILDCLFPPGAQSRVPIAAVTGTNGKTTTSHMLAHIHQTAGKCVGLCSTVGISVGGRLIKKGDLAGWGGAGGIMANPKTEVAVLETAHGGLANHGLGVQFCNVGAVLNVTMDHLGDFGIDTVEKMADVKSLVVKAATDTAVLNADDKLCLAMAEKLTAQHLCLVTMRSENADVAAHIKAGGRAALVEAPDGRAILVLYDDGERLPLIEADAVPATYLGAARHNIQNALFAAAMAYAMGRTPEEISAGLAGFDCSHDVVPGRANLYEKHPFKVVVDFAHNPGAFEAIGRMVGALSHGGRRICVFTSPKDRNDAHLAEVARTVAGHFDYFICRESAVARGGTSVVSGKLRDALVGLGIAEDCIAVIPDEDEAVMAGLKMAASGDVLFIMFSPRPDNRVWEVIQSFDSSAAR